MEKRIIGRTDKIDIPDLQLYNVDVKIDTGAYTSALHCHCIEMIEINGKRTLTFNVLDPGDESYVEHTCKFERFRTIRVKSSFGQTEKRYAVVLPIVIFDKTYKVEFSLTDRIRMKYPVLLGRKFLSRKFLVDVNRADLSYHHKINKV
jgi:hypothetical protein